MGWGTEDDDDAAALIGAVLEASAKYSVPLYPETHRATIFQDPWRTVQFLKQFPSLEFNGDFSHWYTGTEMVYGGFENKLEFIRPVLERVGFIHGRIGNPGCMQVDIGDGNEDEASVRGSLPRAVDRIVSRVFCAGGRARIESASRRSCWARNTTTRELFDGHEESDRWEQSLVLVRIARECFAEARRRWELPKQQA